MNYADAMRRLRGHSLEELLEMQRLVEANPDNQHGQGIYRFSPAARRRLDLITRAIADLMAAQKGGAA